MDTVAMSEPMSIMKRKQRILMDGKIRKENKKYRGDYICACEKK